MEGDNRRMLEEADLRRSRAERRKKIVSALLEQCRDEGMTVQDVQVICKAAAIRAASSTTLRAGLALE